MTDATLNVVGIKIDPKPAQKGADQVEQSLNSVSNTAKNVRRALLAAFAGISVTAIIREYADFSQGLKNVATVAGATAREFDMLNRTAKELALGTRFDPRQVTEGMYSLASAGQKVNEIMGTLPNVLNLAEAAQADLGTTTELTVSSMAQFGIEASDSQRVVDVFTASIANSATNVQRLQVAMANSGAIANAYNQEFESSVAVVSLLTTAFGNGEKAGTGYKTMLTQLVASQENLGISVFDSSGKMKPLVDILDDLSATGLSTTDIMQEVGSIAGPSLAILMEEGSEGVLKMRDSLLSTGQAGETAKKQLDTIKGDIDQFKSAVAVAFIELGEASENGLRPAIQTLTKAVVLLITHLDTLLKTVGLILGAKGVGALASVFVSAGTAAKAMAGGLTVANASAVVLSRTMTGLKAAMAFLGGPAGVAALAAYGIYTFATRAKEARPTVEDLRKETEQLTDSLKQFGAEAAKIELTKARNELADFSAKLTEMEADLSAGTKNFAGLPKATEIGIQRRREVLEAMREKVDQLKATYLELHETEKKGIKITEQSTAATKKLRDETVGLAKATSETSDETKAFTSLLQSYETEMETLTRTTDEQVRSVAAWIREQNYSNEAIKESIELLRRIDDGFKSSKLNIELTKNETAKLRKELLSLGVPESFLNQMSDMAGLFSGMQSVLSGGGASFGGNIFGIAGMFKDIAKTIGESVKDGMKEGYKDSFGQQARGFFGGYAGEPGSSIASRYGNIAQTAGNAWQAADGKDSAGQIAQTAVAVLAMIPGWGQAISSIAAALDSISGGKLFGTAFEFAGAGLSAGIGSDGVTGSQYTQQQRQRSFFRGRELQIDTSELDSEIQKIMQQILDGAIQISQAAAQALGVDVPELVSGSIKQEFDADGELVSSISTVLGRTFNEGFEEFAKRISAENIIASLNAAFEQIEVTYTDHTYILDDYGRYIGGFNREMTRMVDEADFIANRWRMDAELFLDGAQMLLAAGTDIVNGVGLLDSLTGVADLIEEMQKPGESLVATYTRVQGSVVTLTDSLSIIGIELDVTRREFIDLAVGIAESAGGLGQAQSLWSSYFNGFYSEQELTLHRLNGLNDQAAELNAELGTSLTFDTFREAFEDALPTLSPQEVATWLRLGEALYGANMAAEALAGSSLGDAIDNLRGLSDDLADSYLTLYDRLLDNEASIYRLINAYDGSIDAESRIADALSDRYELELQYIAKIRSAAESINTMFSSGIEDIQTSQMTDQERYDYYTGQAESRVALLRTETDPDEIRRISQEINQYRSQAWALLDEGQQSEMADGFIDFLEGVNTIAQDRLSVLEADAVEQSDRLLTQLETMFAENQEVDREIQEKNAQAAETQKKAAEMMQQAAQMMQNINVNVNVNQPQYEVGVA